MRGHMRDPAHGGANPPLDPDYPAATKCVTHGFSTIGGSGERSFRCIALGLGVFAGRQRRWLKVSGAGAETFSERHLNCTL